MPGSFHTVEPRHPVVKKYGEIVLIHRVRGFHLGDSRLAVTDAFRRHLQFLQPFAGVAAGDFVVVHHQDTQTGQHAVVDFDLLHSKIDRHGEPAAFSIGALNLNCTAHQFSNFLADGHTQPCSLHRLDFGVVRPFKGLEYPGEKLRLHANAGIRDYKLVISHIGLFRGLFVDFQRDTPALRRVFHGVGQ